jgi:catechol 2,3-dioxygenase-like lactoylglutathione lyase family enzyme
VLAVLGIRVLGSDEESADYGSSDFFFSVETPVDRVSALGRQRRAHRLPRARPRGRARVSTASAWPHGGRDAGRPGLRPEYDGNYYGAFLLDPDGNKIEAVTFSAD